MALHNSVMVKVCPKRTVHSRLSTKDIRVLYNTVIHLTRKSGTPKGTSEARLVGYNF